MHKPFIIVELYRETVCSLGPNSLFVECLHCEYLDEEDDSLKPTILFFLLITIAILQIVGEIKAAREALIEVTTRLRSYTYRDLFPKETPPPPVSAPSPMANVSGTETASLNNNSLPQENHTVIDPVASIHQNGPNIPTPHSLKVFYYNSAQVHVK